MAQQLGDDGDWCWWRFVASNGCEIFRSSEGYRNWADVIGSVEIARVCAGVERVEQRQEGKCYHFAWRAAPRQ